MVDDEPAVRRMIAGGLRSQGWTVIEAGTGAEALAALERDRPDAVTLDVNLRGESGYDLCRRIRATSNVPIIFLTARSDEFDQVLGLEIGADDFLTKPFSHRVLAARLTAVLRRGVAAAPDGQVAFGLVTIDRAARRVTVGSTDVRLTRSEFDLLEAMLSEPRRVYTRDELLDRVRSEEHTSELQSH